MRTPSPMAIAAAAVAAIRSPCVKSKRGAVLFNPVTGLVTTGMWNSRPDNKCDTLCQPSGFQLLPGSVPQIGHLSRCSMLCVHAEVRAIRVAGLVSERSQFVADGDMAFVLTDLELVHVKVNNRGTLVPSGPPSCWQCAKEIADTGLLGVWLYEADEGPRGEAIDTWNFYPNKQFYELTMKECKLGGS
jgi:deoxycytidylate deaminase